MFFPCVGASPLGSHSWLIRPPPSLAAHTTLKRAEQAIARQLLHVASMPMNGVAPVAGGGPAQSNATGIQMHPYHSRPGAYSHSGHAAAHAGAPAGMVVQQDLGMTPAPQDASGEIDQGEEEEEGEELVYDDDADADGQDYTQEQGDEQGEEEEAQPADLSDEAMQQDSGAYESNRSGQVDDDADEDARLDAMDPHEMNEDEQIRFLQRAHEREERQRVQDELSRTLTETQRRVDAQRQAAAHQQQTPMPPTAAHAPAAISPDDAMHITPPTRSQRAAVASASSAVAPMPAAGRSTVAAGVPSLMRSRARPAAAADASPFAAFAATPVAAAASSSGAPRTVRRTLDLDSSNDSMQIDTPPRPAAHQPQQHQQQQSYSLHATPASAATSNSFFATPTSAHHSPAGVSSTRSSFGGGGSGGVVAPPSMSSAMLAELGLSAEDAEALMAEEIMVLEQARQQQRLRHMRT